MKTICFIFPLVLFFTVSCVRQDIIDIDVKNKQAKLVILAYLTPSDSVRVYIGKSIPFGKSDEDSDVFDATVILTNTKDEAVQLTLSEPSIPIYVCSQKDFPILEGHTYKIKVSVPNLKTATAVTTVPIQKAIWTSARISQTNDGISAFSGAWDALPNETDIDYGVFVYRSAEPIDFLFGNASIIPKTGGYTVEREIYVGRGLKAVLLTRTKILGQFSKMGELTREMEMYYSNAGFYDIISGFKGIIPQFSNIENGLGVFGSYLLHSEELN